MPTRLKDLPKHDRPRERLLRRGPEALSEQELLALILRQGRRGENALELARSLLSEYGDLAALGCARAEELSRQPGVGPAKAAALVAAFRVGRLTHATGGRPVLRAATDIARVAMTELAGLRTERLLILVCDAQNRLRQTVSVNDGGLDRTSVPLRDVLAAVLRHDGRAFAIAHNHPSGDPTPSDCDRRATREMEAAARSVGLRFLDHVVVAEASWRRVSR